MTASSEPSPGVSCLWSQLTHPSKLERDKGVSEMETALALDEANPETEARRSLLQERIQTFALAEYKECKEWETKLGFLLGTAVLYTKQSRPLPVSSDAFVRAALHLLTDEEVRVRSAAADLLGVLCKSEGAAVYEAARDTVLALIKENLERQPDEDASEADKETRKTAEAIFHDTAGWKNLETSMQCLRRMVEGLGRDFQRFLDAPMIDLVRNSLGHKNRFVRETGYYTLTSFVQTGTLDKQFGDMFAEAIALGLADNWSQVRLSASVACREFLREFEDRKQDFYSLLLPRLCLNRYYMAEGVKLYSQETWKRALGEQGRVCVQNHLPEVVAYYVDCTRADNHAVREAACHCIAELAVKLEKASLSPHVETLLDTLVVCFQDDSWPVRDTACVAAGRFVKAFPAESRVRVPELFPLFVGNLKDPIASVRQGAAQALANLVLAYSKEGDAGGEYFPKALELIREGLRGLKDQPEESHRYTDLSTDVTTFGVAKKLRDNDAELHENQPMFSCGSLAPKMGRGGCTDGRFKKPSEPWEFADGSVHLLTELCNSLPSTLHGKLHPLLVPLSDSLRVRHFTLHLAFAETVWKRMSEVAGALGKRNFKPYLEEFMDSLFYAAESENALARAAADRFICFLNDYLGPSILRGRVELLGPSHLTALERALMFAVGGAGDAVEPMFATHDARAGAIGIPGPRRDAGDMPMLGGTPP